jgi:hypothetical protein
LNSRVIDHAAAHPAANMKASKCFAAICLIGLVAGTAFLFNVTRYVSSPDERDTTPSSPTPLEYVKMRPLDAIGYLAFSESLASESSVASLAWRSRTLNAAAFLAPTDPQIVRAAAALALSRGDVPATLENLAKLAVMSPNDRAEAFEALSKFVTHPEWQDFATARLKTGWKEADEFLVSLCNRPSTTEYSLAVANHFAKFRPIAPAASHCVENRAIASGQVKAAYQLRLNGAKTLPSRIGYVFNGDFELAPSGSAFDWAVESGGEYREGFVAAIRPEMGSDNLSRVLSVRFTRRAIRSPIARQILALPTARYQLSYRSKVDSPLLENALAWTLTCVNSGALVIVEKWSAASEKGGWKRHSVPFNVSDTCNGQLLSLDPKSKLVGLEGLIGTLLIDDVRVESQ